MFWYCIQMCSLVPVPPICRVKVLVTVHVDQYEQQWPGKTQTHYV